MSVVVDQRSSAAAVAQTVRWASMVNGVQPPLDGAAAVADNRPICINLIDDDDDDDMEPDVKRGRYHARIIEKRSVSGQSVFEQHWAKILSACRVCMASATALVDHRYAADADRGYIDFVLHIDRASHTFPNDQWLNPNSYSYSEHRSRFEGSHVLVEYDCRSRDCDPPTFVELRTSMAKLLIQPILAGDHRNYTAYAVHAMTYRHVAECTCESNFTDQNMRELRPHLPRYSIKGWIMQSLPILQAAARSLAFFGHYDLWIVRPIQNHTHDPFHYDNMPIFKANHKDAYRLGKDVLRKAVDEFGQIERSMADAVIRGMQLV